MASRKGTKKGRTQAPRQTKAKQCIFAPNERTIPTSAAVTTVSTGAKSPTAQVKIPIPDEDTDPVGVRVVGWKVVAASTNADVKFNLGANFGKTVTVHVPADKRNATMALDVIGETDATYAMTFVTTVYYVNDAFRIST